MSSAIAAAKRRRAFNQDQNSNNNNQKQTNNVPSPTQQSAQSTQSIQSIQSNQPNNKPQTMQEFVKSVDSRLSTMESRLNEVIDEYETRFTLLAEEIANMKDVIIKVQSFSMEINKDLHNERIQVLSDIESKPLENINESITNDTFDNSEHSLLLDDIENINKQNNINTEEELPTFS